MKINRLIFIFLLISISTFSQTSVIRKGTTEVVEIISKNSYKLLSQKSHKQLIEGYATVVVKNGLGKKTRIKSPSLEKILTDTYELRGKTEMIKTGQKMASLNVKNLNSIKGYLAEELHHNYLYKIKGLKKIQSGVRNKSSKYVQQRQGQIIEKYKPFNKDLYIHKNIEIDLIASYKSKKIFIEVKNIDSGFTKSKFAKVISQCAKQSAFAKEVGVSKIFWSNIGQSLLSTSQIKELDKLGVTVLQHGSTSPIINAKINMNKMNRLLTAS